VILQQKKVIIQNPKIQDFKQINFLDWFGS